MSVLCLVWKIDDGSFCRVVKPFCFKKVMVLSMYVERFCITRQLPLSALLIIKLSTLILCLIDAKVCRFIPLTDELQCLKIFVSLL